MLVLVLECYMLVPVLGCDMLASVMVFELASAFQMWGKMLER